MFAIPIGVYPATKYIDGTITAKEYIKYHCPFRIKGAVIEVHDGWLWVWPKKRSRKPWELRDKDYRATNSYKEWRLSVFNRDNFTCQKCNMVGGKLEAHHIKKFHDFPELRFDVANGITLCRNPCHMEEHRGAKF
jgi:hypothetical protein